MPSHLPGSLETTIESESVSHRLKVNTVPPEESDVTTQLSEPRTAQPNIQDLFLNSARRDRLSVTISLLDGRQFEARIKHFDRFAVIVEVNDADQLIFKHAISTIDVHRSVSNYVGSHHS
jgi:host factor-I protein